MDIMEKLTILGDAAKYDVSCASSGLDRSSGKGAGKGLGNSMACGICHTWTEDGRCISLLKVLMSNACCYDCAYCTNRRSNDTPRASFTPNELAELTMEFYRRNYIEGVFLSSAVVGSPDKTMELFIKTLELLRFKYYFRGYIHTKVIPGASQELVERVGYLADRVSVNAEFATQRSLQLLAGDKQPTGILKPMEQISLTKRENTEDRMRFRRAAAFAPAGQSTQMIVGATPERDLTLLRLADAFYGRYSLKRVYYSAYIPLVTNPLLPAISSLPPLKREHRLYQADWLMRFYGFTVDEIVDESKPDLDLMVDPKISYALRHPELFPVEINTADLELLLRVPGIGVTSARRIIEARRFGRLDEEGLKKTGAVLKRARFFITVNGKFRGSCLPDDPVLYRVLSDGSPDYQLSLFDNNGGSTCRPDGQTAGYADHPELPAAMLTAFHCADAETRAPMLSLTAG